MYLLPVPEYVPIPPYRSRFQHRLRSWLPVSALGFSRRMDVSADREMVEMGGIEPPSRNFRQEYPTSLVEVLDFAAWAALDGVPFWLVGWS